MKTISVNYTLIFELKTAQNYQFTKCGKCFNAQTGRRINQVLNNGSIGYNIKGRFRSLTSLRKELQKIEKNICPF